MRLRIAVFALLAGAFWNLPATGQPAVAAIVNAATNRFQELPFGGIAQGALAVVYGSGMGPQALVQANAYPLAANLAGTSISITVSGISIAGLMIYSSDTQVAFIVPSQTRLGTGEVRVTYNQQSSAPAPIEIVASNMGIYTFAQSGSGQAVATDGVTNAVITLVSAATPGEVLNIWSNGLGASPGDESRSPTPGALALELDAFIGNQKAEILYKGRSGCCSGLDQIVLRVPANAPSGCYVPIYFRSGSFVGNVVTLPIASNGGHCQDPFHIPNPSLLDKPSFTIGQVVLDRIQDLAVTFSPGTALFQRYDGRFYDDGQIVEPPPGTCIAIQARNDQPGVDPARPLGLDAGPSVALTVQGTRFQLGASGDPGSYFADFGTGGPILLSGPATLANASGGSGLGAFQLNFTADVLLSFQWPGQGRLPDPAVDQPPVFNWTGGTNGSVQIAINAAVGNKATTVFCTAPSGANQFTFPVDMLRLFPKVKGFVSVEYRQEQFLTGLPAALDAVIYKRRIRLPQDVTIR